MKSRFLFKRIFASFVAFCLSAFVLIGFSGCTRGNYKFVGIIGSDNITVTKFDEIEDVDQRELLETLGYSKSNIILKSKGRYEWNFIKGSDQFSTTTKISGEYKIENEKIVFTHSNSGEVEDSTTSTCDFVGGGIVVYIDGFFLVYKK